MSETSNAIISTEDGSEDITILDELSGKDAGPLMTYSFSNSALIKVKYVAYIRTQRNGTRDWELASLERGGSRDFSISLSEICNYTRCRGGEIEKISPTITSTQTVTIDYLVSRLIGYGADVNWRPIVTIITDGTQAYKHDYAAGQMMGAIRPKQLTIRLVKR